MSIANGMMCSKKYVRTVILTTAILCTLILSSAILYMDSRELHRSTQSTRSIVKAPRVKKETHRERPYYDVVMFSSWISDEEKDRGYRNLLQNWKLWHPFIQPLVFTGDENVTRTAIASGWFSLPEKRNPACGGPPLLPPMFLDAEDMFEAYFYGFANADIVFSDNLKETMAFFIEKINTFDQPVMIVGRRTNFEFHTYPKDIITADEIQNIVDRLDEVPKSTDYFFTTKDFPWEDIIPLSIGRPTFCRWIMSYARKIGAIVIDATETIAALHLTTEDGIKSSWHIGGNGLHCNEDVIDEHRQMDIILSLGWVECMLLETYRDSENNIQLRERNVTLDTCPKPYK